MIQGVRTSKSKQNRAGLFQPANILDLVVYQKPQQNLQRIKEYQPAIIYKTMQEDVVKNCIALFSSELLLKLLPEHAPAADVFALSIDYFSAIDTNSPAVIGNYPLFFIIECSRLLGYEIRGTYSSDTPYLNLQEGEYTSHPPQSRPFTTDEEAQILSELLKIRKIDEVNQVIMNGEVRFRLLEWYIQFLQQHTQYIQNIKSLGILRTILH